MKQQKGFRVEVINHVRSRLTLTAGGVSAYSKKKITRERTAAGQAKVERDRIIKEWGVSANTARTAFRGGKVTLLKHEAIIQILIYIAKEKQQNELLPIIDSLRNDPEGQIQAIHEQTEERRSGDQFIEYWPSRLAWNAQKLGHVIQQSSKLLIIDSITGPKIICGTPLPLA